LLKSDGNLIENWNLKMADTTAILEVASVRKMSKRIAMKFTNKIKSI